MAFQNCYTVCMHPSHADADSGSFLTSRAFALGSLLAANLLTILFFVVNGGSILQVWWIYWLQSVIIGAVNVARILKLNVNPQDIKINNAPVSPVHAKLLADTMRILVAAFFILHYGGAHFVYFVFLLAFTFNDTFTFNGVEHQLSLGEVSLWAILLGGLGFALHHVLSFVDEQVAVRRSPAVATASVWGAMAQPYLRVIPMHLILIIGPVISVKLGNEQLFLIFMLLKTVFDVQLYKRGTSHKAATQTVPTPTH